MEMKNPLVQLLEKYQKGNRPVFPMGPFLPLVRIREKGLSFNEIMKDSEPMTEAALMSFDFGFESTILPFDLNVEAEILGAEVRYHDAVDGNPVYPTVVDKPVATVDDIEIPNTLSEKGRMPVILETIRSIKDRARDQGPVGIFLPGPFTLAGQVMGVDELYLMLLKQPASSLKIFERLTTFIHQLIDVYVREGVDFMIVVEGGGASISPKVFRNLILPCMQDIFKAKKIPQVVYLFGSSEKVVEFMLACNPDGIVLDKECSIEKARDLLPESMPLFTECGGYDMLANSTPAAITEKVNRYLEMGFTTVGPPADIYPPAKNENIEAFVRALQNYKG
jgi:[methyl-Co(III) methanol-specific corrinoid protein]:coenzyme M methyltransferase